MHKKADGALEVLGESASGAPFSVRVLDAAGRELMKTEEPTLHAAVALARERLRARIYVDAGAHKAEVRSAQGLIFDMYAMSGA